MGNKGSENIIGGGSIQAIFHKNAWTFEGTKWGPSGNHKNEGRSNYFNKWPIAKYIQKKSWLPMT